MANPSKLTPIPDSLPDTLPEHVSEELARASKERKIRKQLKRAVARARRVEREGLAPEEFYCYHCAAPPGERCETPQGRAMPYPFAHQRRRQDARARYEAIIDVGHRARKELRKELAATPETTSQNLSEDRDTPPMKKDLNELRNAFGNLTEEDKQRVLKLYKAPTPELWGLCSGISLAPGPGFGLTLWQALLAVDPENTPNTGPSFKPGQEACPWNWAPTTTAVEQAIAYAATMNPKAADKTPDPRSNDPEAPAGPGTSPTQRAAPPVQPTLW